MVEKNAKEFKYMKFSTLRDLGTGFLGFLFCLSLSVVLILNFRPLYVYEMKSENLASVSSMTEEEILEEYDALIRYNSLFYRGELTFPSLPMSEEGRIHFEEVKGIFDGIQILLILSALTFLPLAVFRIWKNVPHVIGVKLLPKGCDVGLGDRFTDGDLVFHVVSSKK